MRTIEEVKADIEALYHRATDVATFEAKLSALRAELAALKGADNDRACMVRRGLLCHRRPLCFRGARMTQTPQALTYRGKRVDDMTREELIEAMKQISRMIARQNGMIDTLLGEKLQ